MAFADLAGSSLMAQGLPQEGATPPMQDRQGPDLESLLLALRSGQMSAEKLLMLLTAMAGGNMGGMPQMPVSGIQSALQGR